MPAAHACNLLTENFKLVTKYDESPEIQRLVDTMDWFVVPVLNPDGYEYTRSSTNPKVRFWRKNRSAATCQTAKNGIFFLLTVKPINIWRNIFKFFYSQ